MNNSYVMGTARADQYAKFPDKLQSLEMLIPSLRGENRKKCRRLPCVMLHPPGLALSWEPYERNGQYIYIYSNLVVDIAGGKEAEGV